MKYVIGVVLALLVLLGAVLGGLALALGTQAGTRWLIAQLAQRSAALDVGSVQGTLLGTLRLQDVSYHGSGTQIDIQRLSLQWRPRRLLGRELYVDSLHAAGMVYRHQPGSQPSTTPWWELPAIALPITVHLEEAVLQNVRLVQGETTLEVERAELGADLDREQLRVARLELSVAQAHAHAALAGTLGLGSAHPLDVQLQWRAQPDPDLPPLQGHGTLKGPLQHLQLVHALTQPVAVSTQGDVRFEPAGPVLDLSGHWKQLHWPLQQNPQWFSEAGGYHIAGTTADYRLMLQGELTGETIPPVELQLQAQGTPDQIRVQELTLNGLGGSATVTGQVNWGQGLQWQAQLLAHDLDPGRQWSEWSGRLHLDLQTSGTFPKGGTLSDLRARVNLRALDGVLRGYPVSGQGDLQAQRGTYHIAALQLSAADASLRASGEIGQRWDLQWSLKAPNLAKLLPAAAGGLACEGHITGARETPAVLASISAARLAFAGRTVAQIDARMRIDLAERSASELHLQLHGIDLGPREIELVSLEGSGRVQAHNLILRVRSTLANLAVRVAGGWANEGWSGKLLQADIAETAAGTWKLRAPAALSAGRDSARLAQACWNHRAASACVSGDWQRQGPWHADAQLQNLALAQFTKALPNVRVQGALNGTASASGQGEALSAELDLTPTAGVVRYRREDGDTLAVAYDHGEVSARLRDNELTASAAMRLGKTGSVQAELQVQPLGPETPLAQSHLTGKAHAELTELGLVSAFVPVVAETRGELHADLTLGGSVAQPTLAGEALLSNASVQVPQLGTEVKNIRLAARGRGAQRIELQGSMESGSGTIDLNGEWRLDPAAGLPLQLSVRGQHFLLIDLPDTRVFVSPDLQLALQGHDVAVSGTLLIPEADIRVKELPPSAVQVSEDMVIVDAPQTEQAPPSRWNIRSDVTLKLGDKVHFQGFNLSARVTGQLRVVERPGQPAEAQGQLNIVGGVYKAYGQEINITEGRLLFAGPLQNPQVDVKAERTVGDVTAGLRVSGTLRKPQVSVYSNPTMDQGEALAYLLLGRPLNQATGSQGQLLQKAVTSLGLSGGELLAKKIGGALGVEDVEVQTGETTTDASLVVGKYLSPKLYVSYGLGLFSPNNVLRLRYKINHKLSVQAESGSQAGADLLYTFEYD